MSSLASIEDARSLESLAQFIDERFADIAHDVPAEVMTSPQGIMTLHELYRLDGVGSLHAMYLGRLVGKEALGRVYDAWSPRDAYLGIRIVVQSRETAVSNDFALDWWHNAKVVNPTSPEYMGTVQAGFPEPGIGSIVESLHQAYLNRSAIGATVIDLAEHVRSRAEM
jgi:hypothetical protein